MPNRVDNNRTRNVLVTGLLSRGRTSAEAWATNVGVAAQREARRVKAEQRAAAGLAPEQEAIADPDASWDPFRDSGLTFTETDVVIPYPARVEQAVGAVGKVLQDVLGSIDPRPRTIRTTKSKRASRTQNTLPRVYTLGAQINAPAFTDGADVFLNLPQIVDEERAGQAMVRELVHGAKASPWDAFDIGAVKGLTYHEFSHILYSPREGTPIRKVANEQEHQRAWNILEDQRIETLFVAAHPGARPLFTRAVAEYLVRDESGTGIASVWVHGRRYLPVEVRRAYEAAWAGTPEQLAQAFALIDEFQTIDPDVHLGSSKRDGETTRVIEIIREFAALLKTVLAEHKERTGQNPDTGKDDGHVYQDHGKGAAPDDEVQDEVVDAIESEQKGDPQEIGAGDDADDAGAGADGADDGDQDGDGEADGDDGAEGDQDGETDSGVSGTGDADGEAETASEGASEGSKGDAGSPGTGWSYNPDETDDGTRPVDIDAQDAAEEAARAAAEQAAEEAAAEDAVHDAQIKRAAVDIVNDQSTIGLASSTDRPVTQPSRTAVRQIARELRRISNDIIPHRERRVNRGVLNVKRWEIEGDIDTAFDRWNPGREGDVELEAVILLDRSDSMKHEIEKVSETAWVLKSAIEEARAGQVSVLTFNTKAAELYGASEKASRSKFKALDVQGGTEPYDALVEAYRILARSKKALRLLVLLTDGQFHKERNDDLIERLNKLGVTTVLVDFVSSATTWHTEYALGQIKADRNGPFTFDPYRLDTHKAEFVLQCLNTKEFRDGFAKLCEELRYRALHNGRPSRWWKVTLAERQAAWTKHNLSNEGATGECNQADAGKGYCPCTKYKRANILVADDACECGHERAGHAAR